MCKSHFGIKPALIGLVGLFVVGCAAGPSRLYPPIAEDAESLRVAEVMAVASAQEIRALGEHYQNLLVAGIDDADLRDGSLVEARFYCCGGPIEVSSGPWVYVPPDITVAVGDVIEIHMGRSPSKNLPGQVNTVISVRSRAIPNESCQWVPNNPDLWMRVIYCDWMLKEGWQERGGLYNTWWKPSTPGE